MMLIKLPGEQVQERLLIVEQKRMLKEIKNSLKVINRPNSNRGTRKDVNCLNHSHGKIKDKISNSKSLLTLRGYWQESNRRCRRRLVDYGQMSLKI